MWWRWERTASSVPPTLTPRGRRGREAHRRATLFLAESQRPPTLIGRCTDKKDVGMVRDREVTSKMGGWWSLAQATWSGGRVYLRKAQCFFNRLRFEIYRLRLRFLRSSTGDPKVARLELGVKSSVVKAGLRPFGGGGGWFYNSRIQKGSRRQIDGNSNPYCIGFGWNQADRALKIRQMCSSQ
jgi:hypothetical protein